MPYTKSHVKHGKPTRAPKSWWYAKVRDKMDEGISATRAKKIVGAIWRDLKPAKKMEILKREGKLIRGTSSKGVELMARKRFRKGSTAAKRAMAKLRALRRTGRRIIRKARRSAPSFNPFWGKRKVTRYSEPVEPLIIREGSVGMGKRKRRSRKARRVHGFEGRKRRSRRYRGFEGRRRTRRYHGAGGTRLNVMGIGTDVVGIGAGAVAGSAVAKLVPIADPRIKAAVPLILGIILSTMKFARSRIMQAVATGSVAVGTISLVKQFLPQIPMLAGAASAEDIIASVNQLPAEEKAMLGFDGGALVETPSGEEVLTGGMIDNEQSPLTE
jgi:hypothetical protein